MRRVLSVWLPHFATDRLTRAQARSQRSSEPAPYAPWRKRPFATSAADAGSVRIAAANTAARDAGIDPGLSLTDARAVVPTLKVIEADPIADQVCLDAMLTWARRYTPWLAVEGLDERGGAGLWLDITGCSHLFGGEQALLEDFEARLRRLGFASRLGLADTPGAAWAAARSLASSGASARVPEGEQRTHLAALPTTALRLSTRTLETLNRLGVRTLSDLLVLPRAPLTRRFGREVCLRLDQLLGRVDEPLSPEMERLPYVARINFAEPIGRTEDVEAALHDLLDSLCVRLEKDRRGIRRLVFEVFRVDNTAERIAVGTGQAVRRPEHLFRLFRDKLDGLDAGFGIEFLMLTVTVTDPMESEQGRIRTGAESETAVASKSGRDLALLIDRLEARLGSGRIVRPQRRASHIPERAVGFVRALDRLNQTVLPGDAREVALLHSDIGRLRPGVRPIHLLPKPEPVDPLPVCSDAPPVRMVPLPGFSWRRQTYPLAAAEGPERIAGAWWRGALPSDRSREEQSYFTLCEDGGAVREYWRVESESGARFWLFYLPFPVMRKEAGHQSRWFLHGLFA
ncbi:MAG: DNA polymerase Y family protein [Rhodospirillaceae bacterium]|nr:DNA polymerase Y family protein [Rhodospirillaceae bacterium]MBT5239395.1 DNA polymerase Y family protein [Rhodospirillaceae bacterium]MBT5564238.1 DNA polymerase Y family protein [Rhodospirillaceae bacterium]MBT6088803.1 DNA polymerase Y family protein [Rhodospirillaceae bacterium]MBT6961163.1 DNA polymerase Y family protein [Rhodospirillaceae bacterium]